MKRPSVSIVSEQAPWWKTASIDPAKSPSCRRVLNSPLSRYSATSQPARFLNLSPRSRSSTARIRVSPRAFTARTRFDPMKPAAPVTTTYTIFLLRPRERVAQLFRLHDRRPELEDLDSSRHVGDPHRFLERHPRFQHHAERRDHRIAGAAHVDDLVRL